MEANEKSWGLERTERVEAAAQTGDASAQAELGLRYNFGDAGLPEDHVKAVEWYRKAAEQGLAGAQACLAGMYEKGCGVSQDDVEAFKWLLKAAEGGSIYSQRLLADCYFEGKGVPHNPDEANKWYKKVIEWTEREAEKGEAVAQAQLGDFYLNGLGVVKDVSTAIHWYLKSAEKGYRTACEELERIYLEGNWPASAISEAVSWFQKAAENGHPKSKYIVGLIYRHGHGVKQNYIEALKWFQASADHKHFADWPKTPAQGEPLVPEAQKAVEETRKLLADSDSEAKHLTFGGLDDLCDAVKRGNITKVKALIAGGTQVNPPKNERRERCPFLIAASAKFSQGEVGGIRNGYDPKRHDYWNQCGGNREILRLLADNGAELFPLRNVLEQSSIHAAARADNADAIVIILEAQPEAGNYTEDDKCPTPLEVAAESGSFQAVKALLAITGAQWRIASPFELALEGGYTRTSKELVAYISDDFPLLKKHSAAFFEMLLWCAVDNHTRSFQTLATKYLNPLKRNQADFDLWWKKENVLKQCFDYACRFSSLEMVKLVFDTAETLDINNDRVEGLFGIPALIYAAATGNFELAEFCLRVGADPFLHKDGKTPLDISRRKGHTKLVVLLEQAMKGNYVGRVKSLFRKFKA